MVNNGVGVKIVTEADYDEAHAKQFCRDAAKQGFTVEHYEGKHRWKGPAIRVQTIDEFKTDVQTQQDTLGMGYVVYPVSSAVLK